MSQIRVKASSHSWRVMLSIIERGYFYMDDYRKSKDGTFSCEIDQDITQLLNIYCKYTGINRTRFINDLIKSVVEEKFKKLKEV